MFDNKTVLECHSIRNYYDQLGIICHISNLFFKFTLAYLFIAKVQGGNMHFPGERLGPVDGQDVAEVARDCPPHSANKVNDNLVK